MKNLKNLQMLCNYRRLRSIRRANNLPTLQTEDVAQHSFYVAILALTLADDYNAHVAEHNRQYHPLDTENTYELVSTAQVTRQALFHDMEEVFTSDIPWNVKHHNNETNVAIQRCIWEKLKTVYQGTTSPVSEHEFLICTAKNNLAGDFVNVADNLEGAWYCYTEVTMGNQYMQGLLVKYLKVIEQDPLVPLLFRFSPLFGDIMAMLVGYKEQVSPSRADYSPGDLMILD